MTSISGFTFVHNALDGGYPIVEAIRAIMLYVDEIVIVDMQSTDGTREMLSRLANEMRNLGGLSDNASVRIVDGYWGNKAGETLREAHSQYIQCNGDVILHFEADEVYDNSLVRAVTSCINNGMTDMVVYRIQLEQNFQRCRWYPEPVHRIFPKHAGTRKEGHTTNRCSVAHIIPPGYGLLWDITNCFRDNWFNRVDKQAELRDTEPQYIMAGLHCLHVTEFPERKHAEFKLNAPHWTWTKTPFDIPRVLKPLVGMVKYEPKI